jgi:hypothetical protein
MGGELYVDKIFESLFSDWRQSFHNILNVSLKIDVIIAYKISYFIFFWLSFSTISFSTLSEDHFTEIDASPCK